MPTNLPPFAIWLKPAVVALLLVILWTWEGLYPFRVLFREQQIRWRHAAVNLTLPLLNTVVLAVLFGVAIVQVTSWTGRHELGLLNAWRIPGGIQWFGALLLLDGWLYVWHWLNHRVPFLWRFHRMHHSDPQMDVTTATRFHLGEHVLSTILRLGLIPLFGVTLLQLVVYDSLVLANTLLHHANISYGRLDPLLRTMIVTPAMHKVHHSRLREETNSNYSTIFSIWDRLARTFRMRSDCGTIEFGLDEFADPHWQTLGGLLRTPLVTVRRPMSLGTGNGFSEGDDTPPARQDPEDQADDVSGGLHG